MRRFNEFGTVRTYFERGEIKVGDWGNSEIKVKFVCTTCNHGWMSGIEGKVQPTIEALLEDKISHLEASAQSTLAVWAAKTTMVFEALGPTLRDWFFSDRERERDAPYAHNSTTYIGVDSEMCRTPGCVYRGQGSVDLAESQGSSRLCFYDGVQLTGIPRSYHQNTSRSPGECHDYIRRG